MENLNDLYHTDTNAQSIDVEDDWERREEQERDDEYFAGLAEDY